MTGRPRRSALYIPGSNARALEKARALPADAVILDLEDAVAPDVKAAARDQVCAAVKERAFGGREVVVRINALSTPWGREDLTAACAAAPDGILIPKVEGPEDIFEAQRHMQEQEAKETRIWAMMETPRAMLNALAIADAAKGEGARLTTFVMGTNDLAKETRVRLGGDRLGMLPWLMSCVAAARANGIAILDGVYNDLENDDGFRVECEQGRSLGMDGKTLIHPKQIEPCNMIFSPSEEEVAWALSVVEAFERPENAAAGVVRVNGQMTERLHLDIARRILALSERDRASDAGVARHA